MFKLRHVLHTCSHQHCESVFVQSSLLYSSYCISPCYKHWPCLHFHLSESTFTTICWVHTPIRTYLDKDYGGIPTCIYEKNVSLGTGIDTQTHTHKDTDRLSPTFSSSTVTDPSYQGGLRDSPVSLLCHFLSPRCVGWVGLQWHHKQAGTTAALGDSCWGKWIWKVPLSVPVRAEISFTYCETV